MGRIRYGPRTPDGDRVVGRVTRLGTTFVELRGEVVESLPVPEDGSRVDFYFKFLPAPDGKGFDSDPALSTATAPSRPGPWPGSRAR